MELRTAKTTIKTVLNKAVRRPQRQKGTRLSTGVVSLTQVFKNKQIIQVFAEVEPRFNQSI